MYKNPNDNGEHLLKEVLGGTGPTSEHNRDWCKENKMIRFSVESFGASRNDFIKRFRQNDFKILSWDKKALKAFRFKPTSGIKTEIAILLSRGDSITNKEINNILDKEDVLKSTKIETAFLILDEVSRWRTRKDLSWIVVEHKPIRDTLISLDLEPNFRRIMATYNYSDQIWPRGGGFAFEVVERPDSVITTSR